MNFLRALLLFASLHMPASALVDFDALAQDFILETKKIDIPGYPFAFNPSIIRWHGVLLMTFRVVPDRKSNFDCWLGIIMLDDNFCPISEPQQLQTRDKSNPVPERAEDGRLIVIDNRLFLVYSDCPVKKVCKACFRLYVAEILFDGASFFVDKVECLSRFEGESPDIREKNWVPFAYENTLLLAYSLTPHKIFYPYLDQSEECETVSCASSKAAWKWGEMRGGTIALREDTEYLAFFHSWQRMESLQSEGKPMAHYTMGAYTFAAEPPFNITRMSPVPIVAKNFYHEPFYKHYWKPVRCIFPVGFISEGNYLYLAYGRQDHECWIAIIDKQKLLASLIPIK